MANAVGSLHTAIGLQGCLNPAVPRAAESLSSGKIGRPLNARIVSATTGFGPEIHSSHDLFNKTVSGANLLTITAGHTLDLIEAVLEQVIEVDALAETLWPAVKLTDTGCHSVRETPDHIDVLGRTRSGAVFTANVSGGVAPENARFTFEIRGSAGWLNLTGGHPFGFEAGGLKLVSNIPFATPEGGALSGGLTDPAISVAEVYAHLDMHLNTYSTPGFERALHNGRLIAAVTRAAKRGERQKAVEPLENLTAQV